MKVMLDRGAYMPERAHSLDAGYDLRTPRAVTVLPYESVVIDTGVHVEIAPNHVGMIKSKSGLNVNRDMTSEGVIDSGYTGSIRVKLYNRGEHQRVLHKGDKISQLVLMPIVTPEPGLVDQLADDQVQQQKNCCADKAKFFPHHGKNKVRMILRQEIQLTLRPLKQPFSEQHARTDGYLRLNDVIA